MKMEFIYDYIFHLLNEYGKLLKFKPNIPEKATEVCAETLACSATGNSRKFMEESLEKSPSSNSTCTLPPPYDPEAVKAFNDEKKRLILEVERWEDEYWESKAMNQ
ncbi:OLC1v1030162C1 [Oldenlandia corymbosa var. corymbosa]|uniref:OLC1v1030162C1 n=1 Tax=Oldenlandia corymbosa var. corymbosa TaxID=529605 RepID=A0AAV1CID4_OLDCO|nr:OLC1v1030162C1 [Oldenlandia corymbosa var. corymbosa]